MAATMCIVFQRRTSAIGRFIQNFNRSSNLSKRNSHLLSSKIQKCHNCIRCSSSKTAEKPDVQPVITSFDAELNARRLQSQSTVVIQILSLSVSQELLDICSKYGDIREVYYYSLDKNKEFLLVEYNSQESLKKFLEDVHFKKSQPIIPVPSQFLMFWGEKQTSPPKIIKIHKSPLNDDIKNTLESAESISEQMEQLHGFLKLPDLSSRLRFLNCAQIEESLRGVFPHGQVYPFGSSVNSFGKFDSDLDMVFCLENPDRLVLRNSLLEFQSKKKLSNDRSQAQRSLETFSFFISDFLPGCVNVHRILQARVPIIKYQHTFTGLDCDLTVTNLSGLHMSELLYLFGEMDPRVRPLVFTIRKWARDNHITHSVPGNWVSNFQLLILVLFFLQQRHQPIITSIEKLMKFIAQNQKEDGSSMTLPTNDNQEDLETLLYEFFSFYENFDFKERGLSILSGTDVCKPDYSALYLQNPLETELNASKNVTREEISRMKSAFRNALWKLESDNKPKPKKAWGLLKLFESETKLKQNEVHGFKVNSLFDDKLDDEQTSDLPRARIINSFEYTAESKQDKLEKSVKGTRPVSHVATFGQNLVSLRPFSAGKGKNLNNQKNKKASRKKS